MMIPASITTDQIPTLHFNAGHVVQHNLRRDTLSAKPGDASRVLDACLSIFESHYLRRSSKQASNLSTACSAGGVVPRTPWASLRVLLMRERLICSGSVWRRTACMSLQRIR